MFGSLFNNLYVIRTDADDKVLSQVKVPLSFSPRRKYLERINEMNNGEDLERQLAVKLPRMSFEIVGFNRDDQRMLGHNNPITVPGENGPIKFYTGMPYIINFQLNILSKNHDDALQVVEQILPFFRPQYNLTVTPIDDFDNFTEQVPITLQAVTFMDDYEGSVEQRRTIIYTLDFEMKANYYGPIDVNSGLNGSMISSVQGGFINPETGLRMQTMKVTPDPIDAGPLDDYGFTVEVFMGDDSDG